MPHKSFGRQFQSEQVAIHAGPEIAPKNQRWNGHDQAEGGVVKGYGNALSELRWVAARGSWPAERPPRGRRWLTAFATGAIAMTALPAIAVIVGALIVGSAIGDAATVGDALWRAALATPLAVLAAGTYKPLHLAEFDTANFIETNAVNYLGVVHALSALIPHMRTRRSGHLACIASVAGYRGLPKAATYGPSKAALINLAESLKPELDADGVTISIINPGFVATPLTAQNEFPMPFLLSAEEAAARILRGLQRRRFEIAFPTRFVLMLKLARLLPYSIYFYLIRKFILSQKNL